MEKFYDRKIIFAGAWLTIFLLSGNAAFSVLSSHLAAQKGFLLADVVVSYPLYLLFFSLTGIFSGRYADRHGCRKIVMVGAPVCGIGWILTGMSSSLPMFYLSHGFVTGLGSGILYNALLTSTIKWFPDRRGATSGLLLSAASLSPSVLAPIFNKGCQTFGVESTMRYFGVIVISLPLLFAATQSRPPENYRPEGWNPPEPVGRAATPSAQNYTPMQMLALPNFYKLLFIFMTVVVAGNMMAGVIFTIAKVQINLAPTAAAFVVSLSTIMNLCGRLSFGGIYDKIGGLKSLILSLTLTCCALLLISTSNASRPVAFYIAVAVLGFAFGGPMVAFPPLTAQAFGSKHLGTNYGILFVGYSIAAFIGPRIAMHFYMTEGNFTYAYYVSAAFAAAGIAAVLNLGASLKKRRES